MDAIITGKNIVIGVSYRGLVAQLGEHHLDKVGVAGSRPVGTIILSARKRWYINVCWLFLFEDFLSYSLTFGFVRNLSAGFFPII